MDIPTFEPPRRGRMLVALALVCALYIALDELSLALFSGGRALQAAIPAALGAPESEVDAVALASAERERALAPQRRVDAFRLGRQMGMVAQMTGLTMRDPVLQAQRREQAERALALEKLDAALGVAPVSLLVPRTLEEFGRLYQLIEQDASGMAGRIEAATSPRHRHLFIAGMHVGTYHYALLSAPDLPLHPLAPEIARHATLAGVSRRLWWPLTQPPVGTDAQGRQVAYAASIQAFEAGLAEAALPVR
jgi:hypothetical protein